MMQLLPEPIVELRRRHREAPLEPAVLDALELDELRVLALDDAYERPGRIGDPWPPAVAAWLRRRRR